MATLDVLQSPDELLLRSPIGDAPRAGENPKSRELSIEKKIEFLESLTGALSTLSDEWRQNSSVNVQFLGVFIVCLSIGICCVSRLVGKFTFPFLIKSCAGLASEDLGMQVHAHVCKFGPAGHLVTENSLMDMYAKFGDSEDAYKLFDDMPQRDASRGIVSFPGMIGWER